MLPFIFLWRKYMSTRKQRQRLREALGAESKKENKAKPVKKKKKTEA